MQSLDSVNYIYFMDGQTNPNCKKSSNAKIVYDKRHTKVKDTLNSKCIGL